MSIPNIPATEVFNTVEYKEFCDMIHEKPRYHRKQWEFYVIQKEIMEHFHGNIEKKNVRVCRGSRGIVAILCEKGGYYYWN